VRYIICFFLFCMFSSCTYSVVVSGNAGPGTDSTVATDTTDPIVSPTLSVPKEGL